MIHPDIFRAYDIRGIVPSELDGQSAYVIGRAYARHLKSYYSKQDHFSVLVQSDARESSPQLKKELLKGLTAEGVDVVDGGFATSPMHYFCINHTAADGGVMVTASHNPPEYNGFKLSYKEAVQVHEGFGMKEIQRLAVSGVFKNISRKGIVKKKNFLDAYIRFLVGLVDTTALKPLTVVIDAGNGMAGYVLEPFLKQLPVTVVPFYFDIDMTFPNHIANPLDESTLRKLKEQVKEKRADIGVAFDGDADRIGFVAENGVLMRNDLMIAYLAEWLLKAHPGEKIVYDARVSRVVPEIITECGGIAIPERVGHSYVNSRMRRENALFGGELSGHFFYRETFYAESSLLTLLYVLVSLSEKNQRLSEVMSKYTKYYFSGEINFCVDRKNELIRKIAASFTDARETNTLDGITNIYDNWWFNVRLSNTEPVVRLVVEAETEALLREKVKMLSNFIEGK